MKKIGLSIISVFVILILVPAVITVILGSIPEKQEEITAEPIQSIKVFLHQENKIEEMELEQYLIGVVAKEVPMEFEVEAIKAQAVAARTYTLKRMKSNGGAGTKYSLEADISTDPAECQAWASQKEMESKWKDKFQQYYNKVKDAVEETKGKILVYNGEVITAFFHSTSGGKTENVEDIYGSKLPYLRSVSSPGEEQTPKYLDMKVMEDGQIKKALKERFPSLVLDEKLPILKQIKNEYRGEGGRIKKIQIGNQSIKGEELRFALSLNSSNIVFEEVDGKIRIITKGYGHGVGMSQYGANAMAKEGKKYEEILHHYYQDTEIIDQQDLKIQ